METFRVNSYLPIFKGFYNSWFEEHAHFIEEVEYESLASYPYLKDIELEFDYKTYYRDCAYEMCYYIEEQLKDMNLIDDLHFQQITSPKEYNFVNDSIDVEFVLNENNIKEIEEYLKTEKYMFAQYLRDRYTSYSGFHSFHSNDADDWLKNIKDTLNDEHKLGSVLHFILDNEGINELDMFDSIIDSGNVYLYSNVQDVIEEHKSKFV
jgi:hypothetical protein